MNSINSNIQELNDQEMANIRGGNLNPFAIAAAVTIIFRAGYDFGYGLVNFILDKD